MLEKSQISEKNGIRAAIMQPYFLPYIGYFQLINSVDVFILYDNIKYTKKGWINRNRMLYNGKDVIFSLPLKGASDYLDVRDREIAVDFNRDRLLNQISGAYKRAPHFEQTFPLIEQVVRNEERNLFQFLHYSIARTCGHLGITTNLMVSSDLNIDHTLKNQDKVLALCASVKANTYVNAIGGMELYSRDAFSKRGINLKFIRSNPSEYAQCGNEFVPWLSIIDVLMFNPVTRIARLLHEYELL